MAEEKNAAAAAGGPEAKVTEEIEYLSVKNLAYLIKTANAQGGRFCFILGSGASMSSGIPNGRELEMTWMNCLMGKADDLMGKRFEPNQVKDWARVLKLEHSFEELRQAWQDVVDKKESAIPSKYYFDIYRLRFFPNLSNGELYLKQVMEKAQPSLGYHTLARLVTEQQQNNLIITTNFDSLVEDTIVLYTEKRPLVFEHESMASNLPMDANRPIIAKVHRGLWLEPFNTPEQTNGLREEWRETLLSVFKQYTPIVIGYGGGDESLMPFLEDPKTRLNGLFWCVRRDPPERIRKLIEAKRGYLVKIDGFDELMLTLGKEFFGGAITPPETENVLRAQFERRMELYVQQWMKLSRSGASVVKELKKGELCQAEIHTTSNAIMTWAYYNRAKDAVATGNHEQAIEGYSKIIELRQDDADTYFDRAYSYYMLQRYGEAIVDYNKTLELNPKDTYAYGNRGNCYYLLYCYDEAIADYSKVIELNPEDAKAYSCRGNCYHMLQRYEEAIVDYNKALELNPKDTYAYGNRGNCYDLLHCYDEAIADYSKAIELEPEVVYSYYNRGHSYFSLQHYDKAIADFYKAIALEPDNVAAHYTLGLTLRFMGRPNEALIAINKAIEINPNDSISHLNKGIVLEDLSRPEESLAEYETAKRLDPGIFYLYTSYWANREKIGRDQDALEAFTRVIRLEPEYIDAYRRRAEVYRKLGKNDLAEADEVKVEELEKKAT